MGNENSVSALFDKAASNEKYLSYECVDAPVESAPGLGHQICNIICLIEEARLLGRIPVLPIMILPSLHNNGIARLTRFRKYLQFDKICSEMDILFHEEVISFQFESKVSCDSTTATAKLVEKKEQMLIREFRNWNFFNAADCFPVLLGDKDGTSRRWMKSYAQSRLSPSRRVRALADEICAQLRAPFVSIHVRRGDRTTDPAWDLATSPENIARRLERWVPGGVTVYILSDEKDPGFFSPIAKDYDLKTSFDFPVLQNLVTQEEDNFMLFSVEIEVMRKASFSISTEYYKGPVLTQYTLLGSDDLPMPVIFNT